MKIEVQKPNIIRIAFHQTKDDPHYGSCLWAYFDFDLDTYMLNIQSDAEDGHYRWCETPETEDFLHLMARIWDDYLIHKLYHDRQEVDVEATLAEVRDYLGIGEDDWRDDDLTEDEIEEREGAMSDLRGLFEENENMTQETAVNILESWNEDHEEFELCDIWERVCMDFTAGQKRVVQIFKDYVQPKIREMIREGAKDGPENKD